MHLFTVGTHGTQSRDAYRFELHLIRVRVRVRVRVGELSVYEKLT